MDEDSVVWDDSYSVGHDGIDYQHKDLVKMTNELFELCKTEAALNNVIFLVTMKKLAAYAKIHFAEEERLMAQATYPDFDKHKAEHDKFVEAVTESLAKYEAEDKSPITMARFLKNWLLNHIAISDKQYSPYLAKK